MKALLFVFSAITAMAAESTLVFDARQTKIGWTLEGNVHTVHGTFQLKSGTVKFDTETGKASGTLVVNALSGESGNDSRDKRMRSAILEAVKFPDIVFTADKVLGKTPAAGTGTVQVHGMFKLHGADHEMTIPVELTAQPSQITISSTFKIPYVKWGLKNPSTFILRVNENVEINIQAVGRLQ